MSPRPLPVNDEALERVAADHPNDPPGFASSPRRTAWVKRHRADLRSAAEQIAAERDAVATLVRLHAEVDEWEPEHHAAADAACAVLAPLVGAA